MVSTTALLAGLLACGLVQAAQVVLGGSSDEHDGTSRPISGPHPTLQTGNIVFTLPTERTFLLNVPAAYNHAEPHPLVLSFHGAGGTSAKQQRITELSDASLTIAGKPFLTLYPQGVDNTAYPGRPMHRIWQGAPYGNTTVDDVAYTRAAIAAVAAAGYNIDRRRVYACGKSNGGGFVALLACRADASGLFAAVAPVSPALYEGTRALHGCEARSPPVPVMHVHGVEDTITPFYGRTPEDGGPFGPEPDVRVWRRQWAERSGCARGAAYPGGMAEPTRVREVRAGVWEEVWECGGEGGAEVVRALTVEGLGHAWPSTKGLDRVGWPNHTANFDLTAEYLVQFFGRHALD